METYKFDCGCEFPIVNEEKKEIDGLPSIRIDYDNLNERCPGVWELFAKGQTKGIFQLETSLGKGWAKKLQPVTIEEVAALTAILRPGMLKYIFNGKSMTQHFVDRKHGNEPFDYFHEFAEPILSETYGTMTYQEQILSIAKVFAGFNLQQADTLRKGIGKKKADIVAKCRKEFIDGCAKMKIIDSELSNELFDNIEKANRYSFNKSHAVCYGDTAFMCAVPKYHFPLHFFTAWLSFAKQKIKPKEEIFDLIQEAKQFNIIVENPNISYKNTDFMLDKGKIRYGLGSIKSVGTENVRKFLEEVDKTEKLLDKSLIEFSWHEVLVYLLSSVRKDVVNNLIHAGALSYYGMTRQEMLYQYNKMHELNDKEIEWIKNVKTHDYFTSNNIGDDIENVINHKAKMQPKRKTKLENLLISVRNPTVSLKDSIEVVAAREEDVLGIPLSCQKIDVKNIGHVNCTCAEFKNGIKTRNVIVGVQINSVRPWSPPKDPTRKICFLTGFDKTGTIDIMVPTKEYAIFEFLLFKDNLVAIQGDMNDKGTLRAKVVEQL